MLGINSARCSARQATHRNMQSSCERISMSHKRSTITHTGAEDGSKLRSMQYGGGLGDVDLCRRRGRLLRLLVGL